MQRLHIVMVDAQQADRRLMSEALHTIADCQFVGCRTASEAVDHLSAVGGADLVVLSLDTGGSLNVIPSLHANPEWRSIPVAILGSAFIPQDPNLTKSANASYPSKPFNFDEQLSLAGELIALAQQHVYLQAVA
jgi:CheY-like chemotaxis protein